MGFGGTDVGDSGTTVGVGDAGAGTRVTVGGSGVGTVVAVGVDCDSAVEVGTTVASPEVSESPELPVHPATTTSMVVASTIAVRKELKMSNDFVITDFEATRFLLCASSCSRWVIV